MPQQTIASHAMSSDHTMLGWVRVLQAWQGITSCACGALPLSPPSPPPFAGPSSTAIDMASACCSSASSSIGSASSAADAGAPVAGAPWLSTSAAPSAAAALAVPAPPSPSAPFEQIGQVQCHSCAQPAACSEHAAYVWSWRISYPGGLRQTAVTQLYHPTTQQARRHRSYPEV